MPKETKKYSILEILIPSKHDQQIHTAYYFIQKWPIYWIACEELEFQFRNNPAYKPLGFDAQANTIELFDRYNGMVLARITFAPYYKMLMISDMSYQVQSV